MTRLVRVRLSRCDREPVTHGDPGLALRERIQQRSLQAVGLGLHLFDTPTRRGGVENQCPACSRQAVNGKFQTVDDLSFLAHGISSLLCAIWCAIAQSDAQTATN